MQNGSFDYYEEDGRCLNCKDAKPGCLCFNCKCKQCYWYSSPFKNGSDKGSCDKKYELIRKKKVNALIYQLSQEIKNEKLKELNEKLKEEKARMNMSSWFNPFLYETLSFWFNPFLYGTYTCQKCNRKFIAIEEQKITVGVSPVCSICSYAIQLTKEEKEDIEEEANDRIE